MPPNLYDVVKEGWRKPTWEGMGAWVWLEYADYKEAFKELHTGKIRNQQLFMFLSGLIPCDTVRELLNIRWD